LADPDLLAEHMPDDAGRHLGLRRERGAALTTDEQHSRLERFTLTGSDTVDEQPLAFANDVLLAAQRDYRVPRRVGRGRHKQGKRGLRPANGASLAQIRRPNPRASDETGYSSEEISSPHSDIGTYFQVAASAASSAAASSAASPPFCSAAVAAVRRLRLRPPRVPRRVLFRFGAAPSSAGASSTVGSSGGSAPRSGSGA